MRVIPERAMSHLPTKCLLNHLAAGKVVALSAPGDPQPFSHVLMRHGEETWLHALASRGTAEQQSLVAVPPVRKATVPAEDLRAGAFRAAM